ncbi:metal-sensitive transcriptional regulator [Alicyclobacillus sp. ALC3]|uniref:metal-sensitive transcriptional regulator n=1 Tax=Alicyclobacillus sp. ALC3 TaxID=2796143 RepID=UPI00237895DE|nr:metal-sensitive transcriptional regulator [Alicyclobacillus sp. ALC3]WDL98770.1 metal-sensitive transcriptional regulator [Alicyclobacillus sp. ALC3]
MEYSTAVSNRLRRIEGQIRGVLGMMENGKDCGQVVVQLSAIRSAVDKAIAAMVVENLEQCIRQDIANSSDSHDTVKQAMDLLLKSR